MKKKTINLFDPCLSRKKTSQDVGARFTLLWSSDPHYSLDSASSWNGKLGWQHPVALEFLLERNHRSSSIHYCRRWPGKKTKKNNVIEQENTTQSLHYVKYHMTVDSRTIFRGRMLTKAVKRPQVQCTWKFRFQSEMTQGDLCASSMAQLRWVARQRSDGTASWRRSWLLTMAMEKLFDKIGDHFNNTEMADRILVVKVRTDGWEQLEAAVRVRTSSAKLKLDSNGDDSEVGSEEDTKTPEKCNKKDAESPTDKKTDSRSESNVSADSGIALEEPKHATTSKRKIKKDADEVDASQGSDATATLCARGTEVSSVEDEATDSTEPEAHKCANGDSTQRNCLSPGELGAEEKKCTESHGVSECCLQSTVVSEYEIHVHSFWLALNSSYFRSLLFSSGMKETRCKKVGTLHCLKCCTLRYRTV